jgi:predicted alpha/beta-fold hydrolase
MDLDFRPARWLKSPHLQTMGAALPLHASPRSAAATEQDLRFPVSHGRWKGQLHARARFRPGRGPAVLIVHGIAGSKDSLCVVRAATAFAAEGYHVIRLDMRGAGDSVVDAPSLYHGGLSSDIDVAVRRLATDPRIAWLTLLGFSGGGSQLLKLAGEWAADVPAGVAAIATVSAPLDYTRVAPRMDTLACLPYRFHVLRGLVERARALATHHPERVRYRPSDLDKVKRFRQYDERVIVPMHGFPDVARYYASASSGCWLSKIEVPTLLLHAEDDPMVPIGTVRPWLLDASRAVTSRVSRYGGHIGWLGGLDEESMVRGWATASALSFFAARAPNLRCPQGGRQPEGQMELRSARRAADSPKGKWN